VKSAQPAPAISIVNIEKQPEKIEQLSAFGQKVQQLEEEARQKKKAEGRHNEGQKISGTIQTI